MGWPCHRIHLLRAFVKGLRSEVVGSSSETGWGLGIMGPSRGWESSHGRVLRVGLEKRLLGPLRLRAGGFVRPPLWSSCAIALAGTRSPGDSRLGIHARLATAISGPPGAALQVPASRPQLRPWRAEPQSVEDSRRCIFLERHFRMFRSRIPFMRDRHYSSNGPASQRRAGVQGRSRVQRRRTVDV